MRRPFSKRPSRRERSLNTSARGFSPRSVRLVRDPLRMPYKNPERQRAYGAEWRRLQRAGESRTPGRTLLPPAFRLKAASDVVALLEQEVAAVREDSQLGTVERARCIGYLAGISLRAIEAGDLAARLEAVKGTLKARKAAE